LMLLTEGKKPCGINFVIAYPLRRKTSYINMVLPPLYHISFPQPLVSPFQSRVKPGKTLQTSLSSLLPPS
jgi:hypothetical protein